MDAEPSETIQSAMGHLEELMTFELPGANFDRLRRALAVLAGEEYANAQARYVRGEATAADWALLETMQAACD